MGFPKYFEDIQKLKDEAAHLRRRVLSLRGANPSSEQSSRKLNLKGAGTTPEPTVKGLEKAYKRISDWSERLIAQLDEILEQATDPEVNREKIIEEKDLQIKKLQLDLEASEQQQGLLKGELAASRRAYADMHQRFNDAKLAKEALEHDLNQAHQALDTTSRDRDALERELQKINDRSRDAAAFQDLMIREGARRLRK